MQLRTASGQEGKRRKRRQEGSWVMLTLLDSTVDAEMRARQDKKKDKENSKDRL